MSTSMIGSLRFLLRCGALLGLAACARSPAPDPAPLPDTTPAPVRVVRETVTVRDRDLEQNLERLKLRLMESQAQVEDLQNRLDETRREVVRSMAKVRTLASRAEAASGMAEAEIAIRSLRQTAGGQTAPELARAAKLLDDATKEFNIQNYGGALWLANQAKSTAGIGRTRFGGDGASATRSGEVMFSVPLRLQTVGRTKLREGPGTSYRAVATLESGASLVGLSHLDQWMRVRTDSGQAGWVFSSLVQQAPAGSP